MMSDIEARPYDRNYEITDAMFGAFRAPGGAKFFFQLLFWTAIPMTLVLIFTLPAAVGSYGRLLGSVVSAEADGTEPPVEELMSTIGGLYGAIGIIFLAYIVIASLARAAFFRRYFHGKDDGLFPFRLGRDEWQQFLAQLGYWALYLVAIIVGAIALGIVVGLMAGIGVATGSEGLGVALTIIGGLIGYVGFFVFLFWFLVRLLPASALTALRGKVHVLAARKVTKNRFWAVFGSALVAGIIAYVVVNVSYVVAAMIGFSGFMSGGGLEALSAEDPEAMLSGLGDAMSGSAFRLTTIIAAFFVSLGLSFYLLLMVGPQAFFTRQWNEADPSTVFE